MDGRGPAKGHGLKFELSQSSLPNFRFANYRVPHGAAIMELRMAGQYRNRLI
jgi:hypothetical protein